MPPPFLEWNRAFSSPVKRYYLLNSDCTKHSAKHSTRVISNFPNNLASLDHETNTKRVGKEDLTNYNEQMWIDHYYIVSSIVLEVVARAIRKEKEMQDLKIGRKRQTCHYLQVMYKKSNRNNRPNTRSNKRIQQLYWIQISTFKDQPNLSICNNHLENTIKIIYQIIKQIDNNKEKIPSTVAAKL